MMQLRASDIYSLAVTWIEMLAGALPSPQAIGAAAYKVPATDAGIADLIKQMHSYNPGETTSNLGNPRRNTRDLQITFSNLR